MPSSVLSQSEVDVRLDEANRVRDGFRYFAKRSKDIRALQGHAIAENYGAGRPSFVCDLDISARFERMGCDEWMLDLPCGDRKFRAIAIYSAYPDHERFLFSGDQESMFVDVVEKIQVNQKFRIASLVRLYRIEDEINDRRVGFSSLFQSTLNGVFKVFPLAVYRKLPCGGADALHDVIKGSSEVVERVSSNQHQVIGNSTYGFQPHHIATGISVEIDVNDIRVSLAELLQSRVKVKDVLIGPFDL